MAVDDKRVPNGRMDWEDRLVVVVGAARSGMGAARLLSRAGARVVLNDRAEKSSPELEALVQEGVTCVFGSHPEEIFTEADLVLLSPGIPVGNLPPAARRRPLLGELEVAARFLTAPVVGVTGTNGKSTVTSLIYEMLRATGRDVLVAGNVGYSLADALWSRGFGRRGQGRQPDVAVLEISSFQLEATETLRPAVSVVLNVAPDHMDRYESFDSYRMAKERIFRNQWGDDITVLNADDPLVRAMADRTAGRVLWFGRHERPGPGVFVDDEGRITYFGTSTVPVVDREALKINGVHNLENALAATAAAIACGVDARQVAGVLRTFPGLPHRMETVGEYRGVRYVNDSKGTNVAAVLRSLESFSGTVHLIAGGRDKDGDFRPLAPLVGSSVKTLLLIGEAARRIDEQIGSRAGRVIHAPGLADAVRRAAELAEPGDTVLLSPGCASFDQFRDFEHRGDEFRDLVAGLGDAD